MLRMLYWQRPWFIHRRYIQTGHGQLVIKLNVVGLKKFVKINYIYIYIKWDFSTLWNDNAHVVSVACDSKPVTFCYAVISMETIQLGTRLCYAMISMETMQLETRLCNSCDLFFNEKSNDSWQKYVKLLNFKLNNQISTLSLNSAVMSQIAKFIGPTWGPPGSCRPQMGPILARWTLLSGVTTDHRPTYSWGIPIPYIFSIDALVLDN